MKNKGADPRFNEPTISTRPIFQGNFISLQVDTVQLPDGKTATREVVKHPGAVAIVALTEGRSKMLVVEQFRKPLEKTQVEIPAGKLEPGEEPVKAAGRELKEETGFSAGQLTLMHSFSTSPGFADEVVHLYLAEDLEQGETNLDEEEFLTCEAITLEQAKEYMRDGRISDAKTIIAIYAWERLLQTGSLLQ